MLALLTPKYQVVTSPEATYGGVAGLDGGPQPLGHRREAPLVAARPRVGQHRAHEAGLGGMHDVQRTRAIRIA